MTTRDDGRPKTYGDDDLTMEQVSQLPPDKQRAYINDLSPQERYDYYYAAEVAKAEGDGSLWDNLIALMGAPGEAEEKARRTAEANMKRSTSKDTKYVPGLKPSDANYLGHEHVAMQRYVNENLNTQQVVGISDAYHDLHEAFEEFATKMNEGVKQSRGEWDGDAAKQARDYFASLGNWADGNAQNAKLASEVMYQQSQAAEHAKNSMPEPVAFDWNKQFENWEKADGTDFDDFLRDTRQQQTASADAQQRAAGVMAQYDKDLYQAASKQPAFADPPKFGEGGDLRTKPGPVEPRPRPPGDDGTDPSGNDGGGKGGHQPLPSLPPNPGGPGGPGGPSYPVPTPMPLPNPPRPGKGSGAGLPPGGTKAAGYRPPGPGTRPGGAGAGNAGFGGMGMMPFGGVGAGFGGAGGADHQSKLGKGGGFGPGGSGGGAAGGGASGAAKPGGLGAAEAAGGRGAAATGAGRGAAGAGAGMGPMGRGKGDGDEDQEHTRPSFLVEADPDDIFGTDQRTAPPVIGE